MDDKKLEQDGAIRDKSVTLTGAPESNQKRSSSRPDALEEKEPESIPVTPTQSSGKVDVSDAEGASVSVNEDPTIAQSRLYSYLEFCIKDEDPNKTYTKRQRYLKKFLKYFFSHVGLTALVVIYAIIGGFLFQSLEGHSEILQRMKVSRTRRRTVDRLWNATVQLNVLYEQNWTVTAEGFLKQFQDDLVVAILEKGWDGREEENKDVKWSYPGSLLYSVTILTTIGYGNITPKTVWGRVATILYALVGIPLTLLCISTMGATWAKCFRFFYSALVGWFYRLLRFLKCWGKEDTSTEINQSVPLTKQKKKNVRVPLIVSVFIIFAYIAGGAVLFSLWEKNWDYLIGAYFCFITLSTIGFGDFVFGIGTELNNNTKLIVSALYLVMGLSIIAMCFTLMQEEVKLIFVKFGKKMGIVDKKKKSAM